MIHFIMFVCICWVYEDNKFSKIMLEFYNLFNNRKNRGKIRISKLYPLFDMEDVIFFCSLFSVSEIVDWFQTD